MTSLSALVTTIIALLPLLYFGLWSIASSPSVTSSFPTLRNKRICLLIAHPDDEAMFFAPTVQALTKLELGNHVKILCLSSGDAEGLGPIRKKELQVSAVHLGLRSESDVFVIDDPSRFPDSMTKTWSADSIAELLASAFLPSVKLEQHENDQDPAATSMDPTIDVVITFDSIGISSHPNHISLFNGAKTFLKDLTKSTYGAEGDSPVTMYTLTTTNIARKYAGIWDAPLSFLSGGVLGQKDQGTITIPKTLVFVNTIQDYWNGARKAMVEGHQSQMVWFRWGWITLGRYMVVNDLQMEEV